MKEDPVDEEAVEFTPAEWVEMMRFVGIPSDEIVKLQRLAAFVAGRPGHEIER